MRVSETHLSVFHKTQFFLISSTHLKPIITGTSYTARFSTDHVQLSHSMLLKQRPVGHNRLVRCCRLAREITQYTFLAEFLIPGHWSTATELNVMHGLATKTWNKFFRLLGRYAAKVGYGPTFRDCLWSSMIKLDTKTPVRNQSTRWFKYDRDYLCVNKSQFVPVIFEPPCTLHNIPEDGRTQVNRSESLRSHGEWNTPPGFSKITRDRICYLQWRQPQSVLLNKLLFLYLGRYEFYILSIT